MGGWIRKVAFDLFSHWW